jgi:hypothetical protein
MQPILIEKIDVGTRFREDMGDLNALATSIQELGLLQPIGVTEDFKLVFGERRLRACRDILKRTEIDARVVKVSSILAGEYAENEVRKDFTPSERVAIAKAMEEEIPERRGNRAIRPPGDELDGRTDDYVAKRVGFGGRRAYREARKVLDKGTTQLIEAMDQGKVPVTIAAQIAGAPLAEQNNLLQEHCHALSKPRRKKKSKRTTAKPDSQEKHSGDEDLMSEIITELENHRGTMAGVLRPVYKEGKPLDQLIDRRTVERILRETKELHETASLLAKRLEGQGPADGLALEARGRELSAYRKM